MAQATGVLGSLELEEVGEARYRATGDGAGGVVFGGLLLGQSILAAAKHSDGKEVKTIHTVFARAASADHPLDVEVEVLHGGRTFGSTSVTIRQGDRLCTRSTVLSSASEPDLMRHAASMPAVDPPPEGDHAVGSAAHASDWQVYVVGEVDVSDPSLTGPPELDVWTRFDVDTDDPLVSQALLAYASDGFLIGTAMRPHEGIGQSMAHVTLSTGVITHTLTFHEPFSTRDWLLLSHHSPYAGRGRTYGRADVFTADGRLVASFVQDAMVRALPQSTPDGGKPAL